MHPHNIIIILCVSVYVFKVHYYSVQIDPYFDDRSSFLCIKFCLTIIYIFVQARHDYSKNDIDGSKEKLLKAMKLIYCSYALGFVSIVVLITIVGIIAKNGLFRA